MSLHPDAHARMQMYRQLAARTERKDETYTAQQRDADSNQLDSDEIADPQIATKER